MKTTRYDVICNPDRVMYEEDNGEYVKYSDIESMCLELTKGLLGEKKEIEPLSFNDEPIEYIKKYKPDNKGTNMNGFEAIAQCLKDDKLEMRCKNTSEKWVRPKSFIDNESNIVNMSCLLIFTFEVRKMETNLDRAINEIDKLDQMLPSSLIEVRDILKQYIKD